MYCKNCGSEIENNSKFCINCGFMVQSAYSESAKPEYVKKKSKMPVVITVIIIMILAICSLYMYLIKTEKIVNFVPLDIVKKLPFAENIETNPYNRRGYVNITGRTIQDIADENDMGLSELLEQYNLPEDMPGDTQESAAYYCMPVKSIAAMYGMEVDELKELLGLGDEVTEDTEWGKAEGEVTLEKYIGEDNFESFKEEYGFGDEITLETKWKEVRNTVDLESKRKYEEQEQEDVEEQGLLPEGKLQETD